MKDYLVKRMQSVCQKRTPILISFVELLKISLPEDKEELIGYCEKIFHYDKKNCEIAYFGVLKEYYGKKYGGFLLSKSIEKSFKEGIERVWLHTCSLDHAFALKNYQARGMKIFKSETVNLNIN